MSRRNLPGPELRPGDFPSDDVPLVVGMVFETLPGRAPRVACRLSEVAGLEVVGGDGDRRLAAVWSDLKAATLVAAVEDLVRGDEEILGAFPTFIGRDEDEAENARAAALSRAEGKEAPADGSGA